MAAQLISKTYQPDGPFCINSATMNFLTAFKYEAKATNY